MNKACAVCKLVFQREPGYFTGAMFFSSVLAVMFVGVWLLVLYTVFPDWSDIWVDGMAIVLMLLFIPYIMRYARVLWMAMDRAIDMS